MSNPILENQAKEEQDETYNTADPVEVNKVRKKSARTRADRLKFVEASMAFKEGRAWFFDFLRRCHVFQTPYINGDTHATSFRCGELNIGLMLLDDIQTAAPKEYMLMIGENK